MNTRRTQRRTSLPANIIPTVEDHVTVDPVPSQSAAGTTDISHKNNNNDHVDLSNVLVTLTDCLNKQSSYSTNVSPRDITQPTFNRGDNAVQWMDLYDTYADLKGWSDLMKSKSFPFFLDQHCKNWFHALPGDNKAAWPLLKQAFLTAYSLSKPEKVAKLQSLLQRKQQTGEKVLDFLLDVAQQSQLLGRSEEQLIEVALQGLLPYIKQQVLLKDYQSFQELKNYAALVESVHTPETSHTTDVFGTKDSSSSSVLTSLVEQVSSIAGKVNTFSSTQQRKRKRDHSPQKTSKRCMMCGGAWHQSLAQCPARGKECYKCKKINHFAKHCKSKNQSNHGNVNSQ